MQSQLFKDYEGFYYSQFSIVSTITLDLIYNKIKPDHPYSGCQMFFANEFSRNYVKENIYDRATKILEKYSDKSELTKAYLLYSFVNALICRDILILDMSKPIRYTQCHFKYYKIAGLKNSIILKESNIKSNICIAQNDAKLSYIMGFEVMLNKLSSQPLSENMHYILEPILDNIDLQDFSFTQPLDNTYFKSIMDNIEAIEKCSIAFAKLDKAVLSESNQRADKINKEYLHNDILGYCLNHNWDYKAIRYFLDKDSMQECIKKNTSYKGPMSFGNQHYSLTNLYQIPFK